MPDLHFQVAVVPVLLEDAGSGVFVCDELLDAAAYHAAAVVPASGIAAVTGDWGDGTVCIDIYLDVVIPVFQFETVELAFGCLVEVHVVHPVTAVLGASEVAQNILGHLTVAEFGAGQHPVLGGVEEELAAHAAVDDLHLCHAVLYVYLDYPGIGIMGCDVLLNAA